MIKQDNEGITMIGSTASILAGTCSILSVIRKNFGEAGLNIVIETVKENNELSNNVKNFSDEIKKYQKRERK